MIRAATHADLPRILAIRDNVGETPLSNPLALTDALARRLVHEDAVWVWQTPGAPIAGFAAIERIEGAIAALLVAPGHEGKGIGRALLAKACDGLRATGHAAAIIALAPQSAAARHYLRAGWAAVGCSASGEPIFRKAL